jgi:hypothetical protein
MNVLRGGCDGMPLILTGEFTGYNNGPTMQVGLWIANDSEYYEAARLSALDGPEELRLYLLAVMLDAPLGSAPWQVGEAMTDAGGMDAVDWAQICYSLVFVEPDDEDLAEAKFALAARMGFEDTPGESETWELAYAMNQAQAERVALRGIE